MEIKLIYTENAMLHPLVDADDIYHKGDTLRVGWYYGLDIFGTLKANGIPYELVDDRGTLYIAGKSISWQGKYEHEILDVIKEYKETEMSKTHPEEFVNE